MDAVLVEPGRIGTITLNRPEVLNAGNRELLEGMVEAVDQLASDSDVRVIVVTGAGRAFCAGADLMTAPWGPESLSVGEGVAWVLDNGWNPVVRALSSCPKPTVAAVNGVAAGGGVGVALACDVVIAAESASFIQVFGPQLAVVPDVGSTWFLTQLLGQARARGLALLGDRLDARSAADWGLIWKAVPDEELMSEAQSTAERLARLDGTAAVAIRQALGRAETLTLDEALDHERDTQAQLANRPAFAEGVAAFIEKRPPRFENRERPAG
jgi:2-(1,2-epoxy-1,2-dihydrophenyl)acetyl-CoA isomerase